MVEAHAHTVNEAVVVEPGKLLPYRGSVIGYVAREASSQGSPQDRIT
ncbi:hypothetical protein [Nitrosovibrio tenuis]|nr:hypothetical protein [Nitrosovibrio tenuis]